MINDVYNEAYNSVVTLLNRPFQDMHEVSTKTIREHIETVRAELLKGGADPLSVSEWDKLLRELITERSQTLASRKSNGALTLLAWKKKPTAEAPLPIRKK